MGNESERETRRRRIDPKLAAASWFVIPFKGPGFNQYGPAAAVEEFETKNGPADYALCDGLRALGVVEAKKVTLGPQNVLTQAERYSRGLEQPVTFQDGPHVPFLTEASLPFAPPRPSLPKPSAGAERRFGIGTRLPGAAAIREDLLQEP